MAQPNGLCSRLGDAQLALVFVRLERRCQGGLKRALLDWIADDAMGCIDRNRES